MIIKYISIILGAIFEIYCINVFMSAFSKKMQIKKQIVLLIFAAITIYHITISCFANGMILTSLALLTPFAISQLYDSKQFVKIILSIGISLINICSELGISGLFMLLKDDNYIHTNSDMFLYPVGLLLSKFIVFLIIHLFSLRKSKILIDSLEIKYLFILSILPITTIIFGILMNQIILNTNGNIFKIIYILLNILLILSNVVTLEVIKNQNKLAQSEYELKMLKNSIEEQTSHYKQLQVSHDEIRKIRHDMKNTYLGTIASLESGNISDAVEQLENNLDIIYKSGKVIDTGHPAIDAVIENKLKKCEEFNIHTNIIYTYNSPINVNEIELAVIIGNVLDNAIEACQGITDQEKNIHGAVSSDENNIVIDIRNTAKRFNNFKTLKMNKKAHGFGLKSISHIAQKYNGYANYTFQNSEFRTFVFLDN